MYSIVSNSGNLNPKSELFIDKKLCSWLVGNLGSQYEIKFLNDLQKDNKIDIIQVIEYPMIAVMNRDVQEVICSVFDTLFEIKNKDQLTENDIVTQGAHTQLFSGIDIIDEMYGMPKSFIATVATRENKDIKIFQLSIEISKKSAWFTNKIITKINIYGYQFKVLIDDLNELQ
jgi:hypothetical protein